MKDEWENLFAENDSFNSNILISDRLEILPEYQHLGYGKVVRHILRDFFSGCYGIEILHSFPLQLELFGNNDSWRAQMHYDTMVHDAAQAHASLNRCYLRTGYTQYQDTEYFYRFPSVEKLDESEWEDDEYKDIDFSGYEEDYYSSLDNKSFKQVDHDTFIVIGKCKLVSKEDKNQSLDIDLEKVYRHHPDLFKQWQHFEFDLSPIDFQNKLRFLHQISLMESDLQRPSSARTNMCASSSRYSTPSALTTMAMATCPTTSDVTIGQNPIFRNSNAKVSSSSASSNTALVAMSMSSSPKKKPIAEALPKAIFAITTDIDC